MADTTGQTSSPIIDDLLQKGHEFSFPQIIRLAKKMFGGGKYELPDVSWQEHVKLNSHLSMSFPPGDVAGVKLDGAKLLVEATFLKLLDCLPNFYAEDQMDEAAADSSVSRDFLEIFQQRIYQVFINVWYKYRLFLLIAEEKSPQIKERLFCLLGLGEKKMRDSLQFDAHLRPIPATTIVAFTPGPELKQPLLIATGAEVASIPVQETQCRFKTCFDVTVHPLRLPAASFSQPPGKAPSIRLQCELNGIGLSGWKADSLRFFLGDDYPAASDLYLLLIRYLKRILISSPDNGAVIEIATDCLKPVGFADNESMLTKQKSSMPGHLALQEYFLFQDKYLFLELSGLDKCKTLGSGSRFEINFELTNSLPVAPQVNDKSFVFFATPVINLFKHKAVPLIFEMGVEQQIRPLGKKLAHYSIYSVDRVSNLDMEDVEENRYTKLSSIIRHTDAGNFCQITQNKSALRDGFDTFLSILSHRREKEFSRVKLDIDLTCTNGVLPEQLGIGDVCIPTATTPEATEFRNIKPVTPSVSPDNEQNRQWRLLSGFSLNRVSLDSINSFKAILRLFINSSSRNQIAVMANNKRIDGIVSIEAKQTDRLIGRSMYRGYEIRLRLHGNHFTGLGDLHMFCSVLERFLGGYVTQNCFIRLTVEEIGKGHRFEWPTRFGDRHVL